MGTVYGVRPLYGHAKVSKDIRLLVDRTIHSTGIMQGEASSRLWQALTWEYRPLPITKKTNDHKEVEPDWRTFQDAPKCGARPTSREELQAVEENRTLTRKIVQEGCGLQRRGEIGNLHNLLCRRPLNPASFMPLSISSPHRRPRHCERHLCHSSFGWERATPIPSSFKVVRRFILHLRPCDDFSNKGVYFAESRLSYDARGIPSWLPLLVGNADAQS